MSIERFGGIYVEGFATTRASRVYLRRNNMKTDKEKPTKPRLAEILGVEVGQVFYVEGSRLAYHINAIGQREFWSTTSREWGKTDNEQVLAYTINHPEKVRIERIWTLEDIEQAIAYIIKQSRKAGTEHIWTPEDIEYAKAIRHLFQRVAWVAREKGGAMWGYEVEPTPTRDGFADKGTNDLICLPCNVLPSVTWENSPVKLEEIR